MTAPYLPSETLPPPPARVAGFVLQPVSVGAALALEKLDNPLLDPLAAAECDIGQLSVAIAVLVRPWPITWLTRWWVALVFFRILLGRSEAEANAAVRAHLARAREGLSYAVARDLGRLGPIESLWLRLITELRLSGEASLSIPLREAIVRLSEIPPRSRHLKN